VLRNAVRVDPCEPPQGEPVKLVDELKQRHDLVGEQPGSGIVNGEFSRRRDRVGEGNQPRRLGYDTRSKTSGE
jgi:hypothetical protein